MFGPVLRQLLALALGGMLVPAQLFAQGASAPVEQKAPEVPLPFVTLDQARLFSESEFGRKIQLEIEEAQAKLALENREIEAELERRERDLTVRRAVISAVEFRKLADAFNVEVEQHRNAQSIKERALYQERDFAHDRFRQVSSQVLAQVLSERGAVAIISEEAVILGFRELDITDAAIMRINELVGDGSLLEAESDEDSLPPLPDAPSYPAATPADPAQPGTNSPKP